MKKMILFGLMFGILAGIGPVAWARPISVDLGGNTFILPLQVVNGTELYSLEDGKGYPGGETVLVQRGGGELTFGGAPVLGTSKNVAFFGLQVRLSERFFDVSDNALKFGLYAGHKDGEGEPHRKRIANTWGIKASIPLW